MKMTVLLHNVRSAHNIGAVFRTADGAGVSKVFLTGYSPTPVDRFKRPQKDIHKTALGAESIVPWEYIRDPKRVIERMRRDGWLIVGIEQDERAIDYREFSTDRNILFILGTEVRGMSSKLRKHCDYLLEIPMRGKKESLNVSVAAGVVLFRFSS